jgi:WD40 repeat protein
MGPDRLLAASSGGISIFELESASCLRRHDHKGVLAIFAMAPNKKAAVSWSKGEESITVWDLQTWKKQRTIKPRQGSQESYLYGSLLSFSPDSAYLATVCLTGASCEIWDARIWKRIHLFRGHAHKITAVQFSPDGSLLASASLDNTIRLWDMSAVRSPLQTPFTTSLTLSPADSPLGIYLPLAPTGQSKFGRWSRVS